MANEQNQEADSTRDGNICKCQILGSRWSEDERHGLRRPLIRTCQPIVCRKLRIRCRSPLEILPRMTNRTPLCGALTAETLKICGIRNPGIRWFEEFLDLLPNLSRDDNHELRKHLCWPLAATKRKAKK